MVSVIPPVCRCSRVLQEEFEKREQLEELKESLEELLQQEQEKSTELEERRCQQEKMLAEEQERLEKLEQERQMRDHEYLASDINFVVFSLAINDKMLSYCRETALQGVVLAKSGRLELEDNILRTL